MNVLLIADIGTNKDGFYHIGDEAMFFQTHEWYKAKYPKAKLSALSRSPINSLGSTSVRLHPGAPEGVFITRLYLLVLIAKYLVRKFLKFNLFSEQQGEFIAFVLSHDIFHFTGGGNFYSLYPPWLYYMLFLIFLGRVERKTILLISQTIGPFNWFDALVAPVFLAMTTLIALREPGHAPFETTAQGVKTKLVGMLDVAYNLPKKSRFNIAKKQGLRIGLSIHPWNKEDKRMERAVIHIIESLSRKSNIEVVLIPHILGKIPTIGGLSFMAKISQSFPKKVKVTIPTYNQLMRSSARPEMTIKYITSSTDLVLSSRYHGVVFALSSSVPVLAFNAGHYKWMKNFNALKHLYRGATAKYIVDLEDKMYLQSAVRKAERIVKYISQEKNQLKRRNKQLKKNTKLFTLDHIQELIIANT